MYKSNIDKKQRIPYDDFLMYLKSIKTHSDLIDKLYRLDIDIINMEGLLGPVVTLLEKHMGDASGKYGDNTLSWWIFEKDFGKEKDFEFYKNEKIIPTNRPMDIWLYYNDDLKEVKIRDSIYPMKTIMNNRELVSKYDFIIPLAYNAQDPEGLDEYDYTFTMLDSFEPGWKKSFGIDFCRDLGEAIQSLDNSEYEYEEPFIITQVKEKFGKLCIHTNYLNEEIDSVINKYERLSAKKCSRCGKRADYNAKGYMLPYCSECVEKISEKDSKAKERFIQIERK